MKCPKCGFNSFEYYDNCKKCSSELSGYKQTYSITSLVLPLEAKEKMAAEYCSVESETEQISETVETHDDMFSFDLPEDSTPAPSQLDDDPFNFDDRTPNADQTQTIKTEEDAFADLLESTSQVEDSPFASTQTAAPPVVAAKTSDPASVPGEFDLESFSWEDTPDTPSAADSSEAADDFDSLFGETKEPDSK